MSFKKQVLDGIGIGYNILCVIFGAVLTFLILTAYCGTAVGEEIPDNLAVRAILGEASGEGYDGMLDVASGIRARGTLKGVYGLKASHVDRELEKTWELARKAWSVSEHSPTHKGDHWGSTKYDKKWLARMESDKRYIKVFTRGNHVFYRNIEKVKK